MSFGKSLHVDLYEIDKIICEDINFCYTMLEALVDLLKMHKQAPPFIFRSPKEYKDKAGLSGWIPLIESGISIHTLTQEKFITIDIYTCGELHVEDAVNFLCETLKTHHYEKHTLERGIKYGFK